MINKRKKILTVSVMQSWGGGEKFLKDLFTTVDKYEFILASPVCSAFNVLKECNVKAFQINNLQKIYRKESRWNLSSFFKIILRVKLSSFSLIKLIISEKPDLIIANGLFAALYILPSAILLRKKFIVVQHLIFKNYSIEKKVLNLILNYTETIICVSNTVLKNVRELLSNPAEDKLVVIPNGIEITLSDENISLTNRTEINIGYAGSIIRAKGIHLMIEALKDILKNEPVKFLIYGTASGDEDSILYEDELKNMINALNLQNQIKFMGHEQSHNKLYSSLDVVINFSTIPEALPFSVLEAMLHKKIVIAAAAGGSTEIISDGENGFLTEPGNAGKLRSKIQFCIENYYTESFSIIRRKAYETVSENYSMQKFRSSYLDLFKELL